MRRAELVSPDTAAASRRLASSFVSMQRQLEAEATDVCVPRGMHSKLEDRTVDPSLTIQKAASPVPRPICLVLLLMALSLSARAQAPTPGAAADGVPRAGTPPAPSIESPEQDDAIGLPSIEELRPTEAARGSAVTAHGTNFPADTNSISIDIDGITVGHPVAISKDRKSFVFLVPHRVPADDNSSGSSRSKSLPLGAHLLRFSMPNPLAMSGAPTGAQQLDRMTATPFFQGSLRVAPDSRANLVLTGANQTVITPDTRGLTLIGEGMTGLWSDYDVLLDGQQEPVCWERSCSGLKGEFVSSTELRLTGFDQSWCDAHLGERRMTLRRGDVVAEGDAVVRVIAHTESKIRWCAALSTAAILGLIVAIALWGGREHRVCGTSYKLRAFLMDAETDTYSLSKLQFYLWSIAALLGYIYLAISRSWAQGQLDIADVPENLPALLAVSAGTAAASVGITAARGPKGAGAVHPSLSDLVTTAGLVSPERFQFLLWTLVAVGAFTITVWSIDPLVISELPKVPDQILALSGVSAAGYLGGKLVRAPGPVIDAVVPEGDMKLTILGRNLSTDATLQIGSTSLTGRMRDGTRSQPDLTPWRPKVVQAEDAQDPDRPRLAKILELRTDIDPAWFHRPSDDGSFELMFTIVNPDGQSASWPFKVPMVWQNLPQQPPAPRAAAADARKP